MPAQTAGAGLRNLRKMPGMRARLYAARLIWAGACALAVLAGVVIFFLRNFAQVLGENGQIPVVLAAWAPPVAAVMMALGLLLHLEDG